MLLWSPTGWPLSLIVLVASIMIPSAKILALGIPAGHLAAGIDTTSTLSASGCTGWSRFIGRWSMVDVFVDTFTAALIQLQPLMSVEPAPGLIFFAAVVVLTMLAVESFDPRLIWDAAMRGRGSGCLRGKAGGRRWRRCRSRGRYRRSARRLSLVWVIPIVAALVGVWVAVTRVLSEGPKITIVFQSAEGLEAGKTKIHYNGVDIGTVTTIRLSDDHKPVIITAQMAPKTEEFLVEDTQFWVVRPRISGANVTGLGTLISGAYIGLEIGASKESKREFVALETPPMVTGEVPGRIFMLKTPDLGSLDTGTPIFFRRLQVGQVASYELDPDGKALTVQIFVRAPYDQYVNPNTRFWHASGVDVSLSASGLKVQTQSVLSILIGGIAFETAAGDPVLPPAEANAVFTLFDNRAAGVRAAAAESADLCAHLQGIGARADGRARRSSFAASRLARSRTSARKSTCETFQFSVPVTIQLDPQRLGVKVARRAAGDGSRARCAEG